MCGIVAGMMVVSALASAKGAADSAGAVGSQANYNAGIADTNRRVAEWQAADATNRGRDEAQRVQGEGRKLQGAQAAQFAANGINIASGTPEAIIDETALNANIDALTIRDNAEKESFKYRVAAQNFAAESAFQTQKARDARKAGRLGVFSSLLTGATGVAKHNYSASYGSGSGKV